MGLILDQFWELWASEKGSKSVQLSVFLGGLGPSNRSLFACLDCGCVLMSTFFVFFSDFRLF